MKYSVTGYYPVKWCNWICIILYCRMSRPGVASFSYWTIWTSSNTQTCFELCFR